MKVGSKVALAAILHFDFRALLGDYCLNLGQLPEPKQSVVDSILNVLTTLKPHWKFLQLQDEFDAADPEKIGGECHRPLVEYRADEVDKDNQVQIQSIDLNLT